MVNFLKAIWQLIVDYFATQYEVVEVHPEATKSSITNETPKVEQLATIKNFALAIQSREGYIAPCKKYPKGTSSYRNNNPGNIKGTDKKFLVFNSYEEGFAYLIYYIKRVQANKHKAYPKDCTIAQYFAVYAPTADQNDPISYANEVATKLGVTTSFLIKNLV